MAASTIPQADLLAHPMTIAFVTTLIALFGYIIKSLSDHGKMLSTLTTTAEDIKELLMITRKEQSDTRTDLDELRYEHAALAGEHKKKQSA